MLNFVLDMDFKEENQVSKRESLQQVINSTPEDSAPHQKAKDQLESEPELPSCVNHIWGWFWDLSSTRHSGMDGPSLLTYSEIKAWNDLKQIGISDIELDILKKLDITYMNFISKKKNSNRKSNMNKNSSGKKK